MMKLFSFSLYFPKFTLSWLHILDTQLVDFNDVHGCGVISESLFVGEVLAVLCRVVHALEGTVVQGPQPRDVLHGFPLHSDHLLLLSRGVHLACNLQTWITRSLV